MSTSPRTLHSPVRGRDGSRRTIPVPARVGQSLLTAVLVVCAAVALSTLFDEDAFEPAAVVLIASFGALAAVLGTAAVWGGIRSRVVRLSLWALPLFFVWHVAALGTWIPDAVFATVSAIGVLLLGTIGRTAGAPDPGADG